MRILVIWKESNEKYNFGFFETEKEIIEYLQFKKDYEIYHVFDVDEQENRAMEIEDGVIYARVEDILSELDEREIKVLEKILITRKQLSEMFENDWNRW